MKLRPTAMVTWLLCTVFVAVFASDKKPQPIPAGAKVYVAPMDDGFDVSLKEALVAKKVPLIVVDKREDAAFEITGHSETQKASGAKKAIRLDWHSNEQASIQVANLKSGEVVWAYSVNKQSSAHGKRSTAEACAKHLEEKIEK
jgi:hypothetical protein